MSEEIRKLEQKRKNGALAAGLNLLLPGAGYMYCGRVLLGIIVLPFMIAMAFVMAATAPIGIVTLWAVLVIDGFLTANRYNRKLDDKINGAMKTCPSCAEKILPAAKVCKHCAHKFAE